MKLEELRKVCEWATPGPWKAEHKEGVSLVEADFTSVSADCSCVDADFIATFNPAYVLKLLAVVEALQYHIEQTRPIQQSTDALAALEDKS